MSEKPGNPPQQRKPRAFLARSSREGVWQMEYEIDDDPQGRDEEYDRSRRDGGITEDHIALQNQSSVKADDYPAEQRRDQSLVTPKRKK
jgi:hypothetical protein